MSSSCFKQARPSTTFMINSLYSLKRDMIVLVRKTYMKKHTPSSVDMNVRIPATRFTP